MLRRIVIYIAGTAGALAATALLLAAAAVLLLLSGALNGILTNTINRHASRFINGEVRLERIEGKLTSGITLRNLLVKTEGDTLLFAAEAGVRYSLKPLLRKEILISEIKLAGIILKLEQYPDSAWNFMKLLPSGEEKMDTAVQPLDWIIRIKKIDVARLAAYIQIDDSSGMIPKAVKTDLQMGFYMDGHEIRANLEEFALQTFDPGLTVRHFGALLRMHDNQVEISGARLEFPVTRLEAAAKINLDEPEASDLFVDMPVLDLQDFSEFLGDLPVNATPSVSLIASDRKYTLKIGLDRQELQATAGISGLDTQAVYHINVRLQNVDLSEWTGDASLKSLVTGTLSLSGSGTQPGSAAVDLDADIRRLEFAGYRAAVKMKAGKRADRINGWLDLQSPLGKLNGNFSLWDVFKVPSYSLTAGIRDVDVYQITGDSLLSSVLNLDVRLNGRDYDPKKMYLELELYSGNNRIAGLDVGEISLAAQYSGGKYILRESRITTPGAGLNVSGEGRLEGDQHFEYQLRIDSLSRYASLAGADTLNLRGEISGRVTGNPDDLHLRQQVSLTDLVYDTYALREMEVESDLRYRKGEISGINLLTLHNLDAAGIHIRDVALATEVEGLTLNNHLFLTVNDSLRSELTLWADLQDKPKFVMPWADFYFRDLHWTGMSDTVMIDPEKGTFSLGEIVFGSGNQRIEAGGTFSAEDSMDVYAAIHEVKLDELPIELFTGYRVGGNVHAGLHIHGEPGKPEVRSDVRIENFQFDTLMIDEITLGMQYAQDLVALNSQVTGFGTRLFTLEGKIPFHLSFTDSVALLADDLRLDLSASADFSTMEPLKGMFPAGLDFDGMTAMEFQVRNSIRNPELSGTLRLDNAYMRYPAYGINMRNLKFAGRLDDTRFVMDSLWMESGRGWLLADGMVQVPSPDSLKIDLFSLRMRSDRFTATNGPQAELVVSSDFTMSGSQEAAQFRGRLKVERGLVHIDNIMTQFGMVADDPNPPLLKKALEEMRETGPDTLEMATFPELPVGSAFFRNLKGEFDVEIPGNVWVRGKDMNFEIGGNIKAIQELGQLDLFGMVDIRRGHYTLYGKRLIFEKGEIEMTGGSEINPLLDVLIGYSFRDSDKQLRKLTVGITGRALQPEIVFRLDDDRIEERDGIAYLMFGRSLDELTQGQQSSVEYNAADIGRGLALGQLSGLLQGALQSSLGLDIVDIEGEDNWNTGSVTIGKYLTRNLFLSYSREFSLNKRSKISHPDVVTLEYQIFRWLYLQAVSQGNNSGFDLIFQKRLR